MKNPIIKHCFSTIAHANLYTHITKLKATVLVQDRLGFYEVLICIFYNLVFYSTLTLQFLFSAAFSAPGSQHHTDGLNLSTSASAAQIQTHSAGSRCFPGKITTISAVRGWLLCQLIFMLGHRPFYTNRSLTHRPRTVMGLMQACSPDIHQAQVCGDLYKVFPFMSRSIIAVLF